MPPQTIAQLFDLTGKGAIVTGAAMGLGQAIALRLAEAGASVMITDIDQEAASQTVEQIKTSGGKAESIHADVASVADAEKAVEATVEAFGRLDILVNNAAIAEAEVDWPEVSPERAAAIVDTNLRGTVLAVRLALEPMQRNGGGCIVNVASGGAFQPSLPQAAYVGTKAGIVHFSRSCEGLTETHGVHVACLCPGMVDTPGFARLARDGGFPPWLRESLDAYEMLRPEQVAQKILALMRDPACAGKVETISGGPRKESCD